jgi:hypothetical protein
MFLHAGQDVGVFMPRGGIQFGVLLLNIFLIEHGDYWYEDWNNEEKHLTFGLDLIMKPFTMKLILWSMAMISTGTLSAAVSPFAGIYTGTSVGVNNNANMAVFVRTNGMATMVGYNTEYAEGGISDFLIDDGGHWTKNETNGGSHSGIATANNFSGTMVYPGGTGILSGQRKPWVGACRNSAGYFSGPFSMAGAGNLGTINLVLSADGSFVCNVSNTQGDINDGGLGSANANNQINFTCRSGTVISGNLNTNNFTVSGTWQNGPYSGPYLLTRTEAAYILPPPPRCEFAGRTNQTATLRISGAIGTACQIQYATNLGSWFSLASQTNQTGTLVIQDPSANAVRRFYRVLAQ